MRTETPADEAFAARLAKIERRLDALDAARNLGSATIDSPGSLQVRAADGTTRLYAGDLSNGETGFLLARADGTTALYFAALSGDASPHEIVRLLDRSGNTLFEEDETGGVGLSRPYIPPIVQQSSLATVTANSGSLTNLWDIILIKQHPTLEVHGAIFVDAATTGEVDLYDLDNSVVVGAAQSFTATSVYFDFIIAPSGSHTQVRRFALRGRRTAGAGNVNVQLLHALGRG
jgi:hypothetical protein